MSKISFLRESGDPGYWDIAKQRQRIEVPTPAHQEIDEAWKNVLIFAAGFVLCFLLTGVWLR